MIKLEQSQSHSKKLIALDNYLDEMIKLYEADSFPKVLLLNGKKGIGKFTLTLHFINYLYSKKEKTRYNFYEKLINVNSNFYNSLINQNCSDVVFLRAEEGKNIKIEDIRNLKSTLSKSSLSSNPRFTIIDEVEFLNVNSANALLKTLEEPTKNNYFILINNQQSDLIETISSRCLKNNIYLNFAQRKKIIDYLIQEKKIEFLINDNDNLSPCLLITFNELFRKYKIDVNENICLKLNKVLHGFKRDKDKALISMSFFLIDEFFFRLIKNNENKIDFLLNIKSFITNKINDFIIYNTNINSVLSSIELKLKNVQ